MTSDSISKPDRAGGILGWIERGGNRLPDPVVIFLYCIAAVIAVSVVAAAMGLYALHPTQVDAAGNALAIRAESLLSADNIRHLLVDMPATFTGFHPLGYVLVVMLGAGVAERSGLLGAAMSAAVSNVPKLLLTPAVALVGMLGNLAADAAYVVLIPLAGVIFAAAGRHPIAGIAAAFAGLSGGFSANLPPGQPAALLLGITPTTGWQFLGGSEHEYVPRGLDGLAKRLESWRERGVAFIKWRVAARVGPGLPTERALVSNARSVAECAALAHQFDLVPIAEPEVEMKGSHTLQRQFEVTERFLHRTFETLYEHGVVPENIVLKTNMVVPGSTCPEQADVDTVARETLRCLRRVVPPALPGIGFLSGGQSDLDATAHLDAMNRLDPQPWALSFSFGRAIGRAPVEAWDGKADESSGQTALRHRARMNGMATLGEWAMQLEEEHA